MKKMIDKTMYRFIIVGLINTLVGAGVMFLLYNCFGTGYWIASAANYIVGSIVSYFLNKYYTFNKKGRSLKELLLFTANIIVCYFIAYGASKPLIYSLLTGVGESIQDNVAMFVGMCLFVILNYIGQRFVVFKYDSSDNNAISKK